MKRKTAETVSRLICKECSRFSLADLCEEWGITTDDFDEFIRQGLNASDDAPQTITLNAFAYPDGGTVNGKSDPDEPSEANPPKMPFLFPCDKREGEWRWRPTIDVDEGRIVDWPKGVTASTYYKPCDDCAIIIDGKDWNDGDYTPWFLCPTQKGYGDYIIMEIDGDGKIAGWKSGDFHKWYATKNAERGAE